MRIERITTEQGAVRDLIALHLRGMHANSPAGHVFALGLSGYARPGLTLWGAWDGEALAGMVALQRLDARTGEIKSMRTHPDHLRRGVAAALLEHLIARARSEGLSRLSLETGSGDAFEPALALYRRRGFVNGAAFGDYEASAFNQFLHMDLG
jgi:putative acetyltransferase